MERLIKGIIRYQTGFHAANADLFRSLEHGQSPSTLFITCADSRVNPNLITDTRPGDLFLIRNAGNMLPTYEQAITAFSGEAATLQYAVEVLQVQHIVICGHTDCGAVRALMAPPENLQKLDVVRHWVAQAAHLREIIDDSCSHLSDEERHIAAIEQNVLIQLEDLLTYPFIKRRLAAGRLTIHGWVYHIGPGLITAYDPDHGQFVSVHDVYPHAKVSAPRVADTPVPTGDGTGSAHPAAQRAADPVTAPTLPH